MVVYVRSYLPPALGIGACAGKGTQEQIVKTVSLAFKIMPDNEMSHLSFYSKINDDQNRSHR